MAGHTVYKETHTHTRKNGHSTPGGHTTEKTVMLVLTPAEPAGKMNPDL